MSISFNNFCVLKLLCLVSRSFSLYHLSFPISFIHSYSVTNEHFLISAHNSKFYFFFLFPNHSFTLFFLSLLQTDPSSLSLYAPASLAIYRHHANMICFKLGYYCVFPWTLWGSLYANHFIKQEGRVGTRQGDGRTDGHSQGIQRVVGSGGRVFCLLACLFLFTILRNLNFTRFLCVCLSLCFSASVSVSLI